MKSQETVYSMFRHSSSARSAKIAVGLLVVSSTIWGAVTVADASGGGIANVSIKLTNTAQGIETKTTTGAKGEYSLPTVPVGTYDLLFEAGGFRSEKRTGLVVDANAAI